MIKVIKKSSIKRPPRAVLRPFPDKLPRMSVRIFEPTADAIALRLLEIGAIRLNYEKPFTWSSGWKSPIYCDNRLSLSYPAVRSFVKESLAAVIRQHFPNAGAVAGVATAGIAQGALVADLLGLPFAYVRPKPKEHGMENLIEGRIEPGKPVILIEDLVSTGGSSLKAATALKEAGATVAGMAAIFTYGFPIAVQNFEKENVDLVCLSDFDHLIRAAIQKKFVQNDQLEHLGRWRLDPGAWAPVLS